MFFLLRTAFWLSLIILILPTDSAKQAEVFGTAEAAVEDLSGFCTRNPEACEKGREALAQFGEKAEFGAKMIMDFIASQRQSEPGAGVGASPAPHAQPAPAAEEPAAQPSALLEGGYSQTLTGEDLEPKWSLKRKLASGA